MTENYTIEPGADDKLELRGIMAIRWLELAQI